MKDGQKNRIRGFIEWLLALRVVESERLTLADDPYNIFGERVSRRRPLRVAAVLACLFHLLLILMVFPRWAATRQPLAAEKFVIKKLARPARLEGAPGRKAAPPSKPRPVVTRPQPRPVPIPDPTPNAAEPVRRVTLEIPRVSEELTLDLSIGEIEAPPGPPSGAGEGLEGEAAGSGPGRSGPGDGDGDGSRAFQVGGDVSMPVLLVKTTPTYTDQAIKAKVQGVVWLRGIVRQNGKVDTLSVVRGLGHGLEENAIQEIVSNWKFRPGMRNGESVDVWATIQVTFNLR